MTDVLLSSYRYSKEYRRQSAAKFHGPRDNLHYHDRTDIYVSGNLLVFYREGDRHKHLSPDVLVVLGVESRLRKHFKIWAEGKAPDFVIEVTSESTRDEDMGSKKGLYEWMGVQEYFLFDPLGEYLPSKLRGYRLHGETYLPLASDPLRSEVLGLELRIVDERLRLFNPDTARLIPIPDELATSLREAEQELKTLRNQLKGRVDNDVPDVGARQP